MTRARKKPHGATPADVARFVAVGSAIVLCGAAVLWVLFPGSRAAVAAFVVASPLPPVP